MDVFDSLLNLEEDYYNEGYTEGLRDGERSGYLEGKQFGIQTAIQRFTTIGILQGRLQQWQKDLQNDDDPKNAKVAKHLDQLAKLVNDIPMTNAPDHVDDFNLRLKKARAKAKVIMSVLKDPNPLQIYDDTVALKETEEVIEDV